MQKEGMGYSQRIITWWVSGVQKRALAVVIIAVMATIGVLFYSVRNFNINTDLSDMISEKLPFRRVEKDFSRAFPNLSNNIVAVIDADSADQAMSARDKLLFRLKSEKNLFKNFYAPGAGSYFEKNGLLYLDTPELEDFADNMAAAQPLLGFLSQDLSLRGLFSVLGQALSQPEAAKLEDKRIRLLFKDLEKAFDSVTQNRPYRMPWQELMLGDKEAESQKRQFIIMQPILDPTGLSAGEVPLEAVRKAALDLGLTPANGVTVKITGDVALDEETMAEVSNSTGIATIASFILVAIILYAGMGGSGRLIFASLATLVVGLIWTMGFAIAFVGSLNIISITFAVLFIGLGIDYSIQFCLRHRELLLSGVDSGESVLTTAGGVGLGLLLSCVTTAIGFYSFLPTAYAGVAQLGLISGTGMFISFFANLTILPALLTVVPFKGKKTARAVAGEKRLLGLPYRHSGTIMAAALIAGAVSAFMLPKVYFDYNPLNLYNPKSEAIIAIRELFKDPQTTPWTASVLAGSEKEAKEIEEKLGKLKEVKMAISIFDFVPEDQAKKLDIISSVALFMPRADNLQVKHLHCGEASAALGDFDWKLKGLLDSSSGEAHAIIEALYKSIGRFNEFPTETRCQGFDRLDTELLSDFPALFRRLKASLSASTVKISDLPRDLVDQYVSSDGRYRVQVFPAENMLDRNALARFVNAVYSTTPKATDAPVVVYESGMAVINSFRAAVIYALVAITLFLLIEMRSLAITIMILIPLALAMVLTGAASVVIGIPLNFANVIVVPLLLGVGVHFGILFVLRYRTEPPQSGNMLETSTARAALFSLLTTMISTGSLSFSSHRGISSIGVLLTLCFGFLILSVLLLMPALFKIFHRSLNTRKGE